MSEERTPQQKPAASKPSHIAYQVREGNEGKSFFNRVGSAFAHGDGKGFNLMLDSVPVDGRLTLRTPQERMNAKKNETRNTANREVER